MQLLNGGLISFSSSQVSLLGNKCLLGEWLDSLILTSQSFYGPVLEWGGRIKLTNIYQLLVKKVPFQSSFKEYY